MQQAKLKNKFVIQTILIQLLPYSPYFFVTSFYTDSSSFCCTTNDFTFLENEALPRTNVCLSSLLISTFAWSFFTSTHHSERPFGHQSPYHPSTSLPSCNFSGLLPLIQLSLPQISPPLLWAGPHMSSCGLNYRDLDNYLSDGTENDLISEHIYLPSW